LNEGATVTIVVGVLSEEKPPEPPGQEPNPGNGNGNGNDRRVG
jgi:hypothetical protein